MEEEEPGVVSLPEGGTELSLPEELPLEEPPVGSVSPPVTKSSFRSGPSEDEELELPPEGVELLEPPVLPELPELLEPLELPELPELLELPELPELPE